MEFDDSNSNYYPILYFNDYWNLAQDYMPVNDTTKYGGVCGLLGEGAELSLIFSVNPAEHLS